MLFLGNSSVDGGAFVFQVRAGHVDHAPLEKMQGHRAVDGRRHQPHIGALQMTRQHRGRGVAAGHQQAAFGILVAQQFDRGPRGARQQRVGGRQLPRRGHGGHAHQPAVHAAQLDGSAREQIARADDFGVHRAGRARLRRIQAEEVFHGRFQGAGQPQRHRGIGNIVARFHGINGLAADARQFGQCGSGNPAPLPELRQPVMHPRLGGCGIVL